MTSFLCPLPRLPPLLQRLDLFRGLVLFPLRDAEHLGDGEGLLLGPGHAAAGGGQPRGEGEGGTAWPPRASLPSCPQGCAGVLGGGLCSGVTLPLPPELHQDLSASLLLAGHHGQRGRGHLEAGRRHRPAQGAQVPPDGRWGQGEGGLGGLRRPPPKLCRFPPPSRHSSWHRDEPNGGQQENCAVVRVDGTWFDYPCTSQLPWVCEGQP